MGRASFDLLPYRSKSRFFFCGKGTAIVLKERMRTAVEREYPETEGRLPEKAREGRIPTSVLELLREANAECSSEELGAKRARRVVNTNDEKNATPAPGARSPETCLNDLRPLSVAMDRSVRSLSDPATQREGAVTAYDDGSINVNGKKI